VITSFFRKGNLKKKMAKSFVIMPMDFCHWIRENEKLK
jgi:hypothetical protein